MLRYVDPARTAGRYRFRTMRALLKSQDVQMSKGKRAPEAICEARRG